MLKSQFVYNEKDTFSQVSRKQSRKIQFNHLIMVYESGQDSTCLPLAEH